MDLGLTPLCTDCPRIRFCQLGEGGEVSYQQYISNLDNYFDLSSGHGEAFKRKDPDDQNNSNFSLIFSVKR